MALLGLEKKLVFSTGRLINRFDLKEIALLAAENGFDGLELVFNFQTIKELEEKKGKYFANLEIPVLSLHAPHHSNPYWGNLTSSLKKTIEIAKENNIPRVVFHPPYITSLQPSFLNFFWSTSNFQELGEGKVLISLENLPIKTKIKLPGFLNNPDQMRKFMSQRNLYLTLDTAHYASYGLELKEALKIFRGLIKNVHLTNAHHPFSDDHLPPYKGHLELGSFLKELREIPDVFLVLEIDFGLLKEEEIRKKIKRSADFVRDFLCLEA